MAIKIRRINKWDLPFILEIRNECRDCLHDNRYFSKSEIDQWFLEKDPNWYIIYLEENGHRIGYFRTSDESNYKIQIGADLHKDFRGKGYAKEAYKHFLNFLFNYKNKHRVYLEVLATNTIAYNLYKKVGFIEEGRKRDDIYRDGKYIDSIIMSILKNEYSII